MWSKNVVHKVINAREQNFLVSKWHFVISSVINNNLQIICLRIKMTQTPDLRNFLSVKTLIVTSYPNDCDAYMYVEAYDMYAENSIRFHICTLWQFKHTVQDGFLILPGSVNSQRKTETIVKRHRERIKNFTLTFQSQCQQAIFDILAQPSILAH